MNTLKVCPCFLTKQRATDSDELEIYVADLLRNIRTQVLIKLIRPYTRIHIPSISKELNVDVNEVESLLVACILDR